MMSQQGFSTEPRFTGEVTAAFPIALLESIRTHDRPGEVLEDEEFTLSLPRRLGLTGVIDTQIRRYEAARAAGRAVRLDEVAGLLRLVMRRPDAEPILRETGQRTARWGFRHTPDLWQRILHRAPARVALRSTRRASAHLLTALHAGSEVSASRPFTVAVSDCITAQMPEGPGCTLFTSLLEEMLVLYTGKAGTVRHTQCIRNGHAVCEWTLKADAG